ncbi:multidrug resistance protein MdtC [mine drainage metagenome]|uniref:Multidrug resistance protein MdtC n=1 Tax=mine drainage metagenome TaxID=410659 RepID=A0A1J5SA48_9ZZZZ
MRISAPFIDRPVATTLLTLGVALLGVVAFFLLPVSPLPQVDFPTILVMANMPGASPDTMATSVATPLERHLGQIADVTEMTSSSSLGSTSVILQFGLDRDIDGAARDVQAAINAARADLPTSLRSNPTYRKVNPADAPIMVLALTSDSLTAGQLYDSAATVLEQKLSQVNGIGQVLVGGSSLPAVRVEINPNALFKYGIGLEDVRAALASANANSPKGAIEVNGRHLQIYTNDQASHADQYRHMVIAYRDKAPVRLSDVADVEDSVEDLRNQGLANGKPAVLVILFREPGANIIQTVRNVEDALPQLRASIPAAITLSVAMERTSTIRASLRDVEQTLLISVSLVILVVFLFLRDGRATFIPGVAVPVSLIGTFAVMYLLDYSLDNLSLMALTIGTGFVVDDAIVVLENIMRHIEAGMPRRQAALRGAREVGFTVLSMSLSLIAVFTPILLMGGIVGRLFREFAVTLSVAILVSLLVSLTTTPMMCARLLRRPQEQGQGRIHRFSERWFEALQAGYRRSLEAALRHTRLTMLILLATVGLNIYLFAVVPKGFFPQQDTGRIMGGIVADQSISFQLMREKLVKFTTIVKNDPAVASVVGFTGGSQTNSGRLFIALKPLAERRMSADQVIARLRRKLSHVPGASLFLQAAQDIRMGGRPSPAEFQYTLEADSLADLQTWAPRLTEALRHVPQLADVNSDQQDTGLETEITVDRATASRLGLEVSQIDNTLYDAFGQRQVSVIYNALNQYHVVMEVAPRYWQNPDSLKRLYVSTSAQLPSGTQSTNAVAGTTVLRGAGSSAASVAADSARNQSSNALANTGHGTASAGASVSTAAETMVPLAAFSHFGPGTTPLAVNHQGHFAASTLSFNLPLGVSLNDAVAAIGATMVRIGVPPGVHGSFQGTAKAFQSSLSNEPLLILAALLAVYIVLGILYESYIHPVTILSTLPSAGVGAVLALLLCHTDFTIIALIGVILLIGIVKKNAIMMIDVALDAQRNQGLTPRQAIHQACLLRFRPIMMTTMVALLGALPLALGRGEGAEMRRPLGIAIVGGLIVSQMLTLYTTPVVYLYLDRFRQWAGRTPRQESHDA